MIHIIIVVTVLVCTHLFCFGMLSELKYSVKKTAVIYGITAVVFVSLVTLICYLFRENIVTAFTVSYGITITMCFFIFIFTSTDSIDKKVFLYINYANIFCVFWGISDILCSEFFDGLSSTKTMYIKNTIRTFMSIPAIWAYIKFLRLRIRAIPLMKKRIWASLSLASVLFLLVFSMLVSRAYENLCKSGSHTVLFTTFLIIYASVLWVVLTNIQQMSREAKMKIINQKAKYLQSELEIKKQNELEAKRIKHDYRHHIQNIMSMLKNGNLEQAMCYIERYNRSLDEINVEDICSNITVNAVLKNFYYAAQKDGISLYASADTQEQSPIADADFVAILSNLLENAINGCKECTSSGEIRINVRTIENKTVIVCSNFCKEDLEIVNGMIKNKGIGIDSIIISSRKYNGDISYKKENGILTACIILKH